MKCGEVIDFYEIRGELHTPRPLEQDSYRTLIIQGTKSPGRYSVQLELKSVVLNDIATRIFSINSASPIQIVLLNPFYPQSITFFSAAQQWSVTTLVAALAALAAMAGVAESASTATRLQLRRVCSRSFHESQRCQVPCSIPQNRGQTSLMDQIHELSGIPHPT